MSEIALDQCHVRGLALGLRGGTREVELRFLRGAREGMHIHVGEFVRPRGESASEPLEPTPVRGVVHVPRIGVELALDFRVHFRHEPVHRAHERVQREACGERLVGRCHAPSAHVAESTLRAFHPQHLAVRVAATGDVAQREAVAEHLAHLARVLAAQPLGRFRPRGDEQLEECKSRIEQRSELLVTARLEEVKKADRQIGCFVRERGALGLFEHRHPFGSTGDAGQSFSEELQAVVRDGAAVREDFLDPDRIARTQVPALVGAENDGSGARTEE